MPDWSLTVGIFVLDAIKVIILGNIIAIFAALLIDDWRRMRRRYRRSITQHPTTNVVTIIRPPYNWEHDEDGAA